MVQLKSLLCLVALLCVCNIVTGAKYSYHHGGDDWVDGACSVGDSQSPINIDIPQDVYKSSGADSKVLDLYYPIVNAWQQNLILAHTGKTLQVNASMGNLGYMTHAGHRYIVKEVHFRSPAEHQIHGEVFPLELQIVHQKETAQIDNQDLVILSVLFRESSNDNKWLGESLQWEHLPGEIGRRTMLSGSFALGAGIDGLQQGYYSYVGSLTNPPCTAGVVWHVLESVQDISALQSSFIHAVFAGKPTFAQNRGNNRNIQNLNGRKVTLHNHKQMGDGDMRGFQYNSKADDTQSENTGKVNPEETVPQKPDLERVLPRTLPELYADAQTWGGLCRSGRLQSPIDILLGYGSPHGDYEMSLMFEPTSSKAKHIGFTIQYAGNFGVMSLEEVPYNATEITFHAPSEHLVDGRQSALEMQILFSRSNGPSRSAMTEQAVMSVLFHENPFEENRFLSSIQWDALPEVGATTGPDTLVNLGLVDGITEGYYSYAGSLSRPPCTQGVKRFVSRTFQEVSALQMRRFRNIFNGNNRPVQPRNDRGVLVHNVRLHTEIVHKERPPQLPEA